MTDRMHGAIDLDDLLAKLRQQSADSATFAANLTTLDCRGMSRTALRLLVNAGAEAYTAELVAHTAPLRLSLPERAWTWLRVRFGGDDPREVQRVRAEEYIATINVAAAAAATAVSS